MSNENSEIETKEEKAVAEILKSAKFDIEFYTEKLDEAKVRLTVIEAGIKATANPIAKA